MRDKSLPRDRLFGLDPETTKKQLKIFLTTKEHTVVTTAAKMQGLSTSDYMKQAVIEKAKIDAQALMQLIDEI